MGDRCSYVIRVNGERSYYYSHWGGATLLQDVFWGPSACEALIRNTRPFPVLLEAGLAVGGVALDKDARVLTFFGGCALYDPQVAVDLMQEIRGSHGWTVRYATYEMEDIAEAVGLDRSAVESPFDMGLGSVFAAAGVPVPEQLDASQEPEPEPDLPTKIEGIAFALFNGRETGISCLDWLPVDAAVNPLALGEHSDVDLDDSQTRALFRRAAHRVLAREAPDGIRG